MQLATQLAREKRTSGPIRTVRGPCGLLSSGAAFGEVPGRAYCRTTNLALLFKVAFGPLTVTKPLVAAVGMIALISVGETTVNSAPAPLNSTLVTCVR